MSARTAWRLYLAERAANNLRLRIARIWESDIQAREPFLGEAGDLLERVEHKIRRAKERAQTRERKR